MPSTPWVMPRLWVKMPESKKWMSGNYSHKLYPKAVVESVSGPHWVFDDIQDGIAGLGFS